MVNTMNTEKSLYGDRLFKILDDGGKPRNGGKGVWPLPTQNEDGTWTPGEWIEVDGKLELCWNGLHAATEKGLLEWLGPHIYEIEYENEGEMLREKEGTKVCGRKARLLREYTNWNERIARLFACDCAERVLPIYEKDYPNDNRPRHAVEVARRFAHGEATREELAAAWDAASAAARAAAWAAAGDAAWAAAWAAARDAASAAARDAAWAAAGDAAWDAASAAASAAARDAAWDAAWAEMTRSLLALLDGRSGVTEHVEEVGA